MGYAITSVPVALVYNRQAIAADRVPRTHRALQQLLASGLEPEGFNIPLRNMRAEAALFRQENLPLISETQKLSKEYDKIVGSQTVQWDGQEVTLSQLRPVYLEQDRSRRESAWRLSMQRWYDDRDRISAVGPS